MYQLPVKIVTFNNGALGMVKLEMLVDGLPDYETGNGSVEHAAIAQAAGIHAIRVEQPADVRGAMTEALAHPGPALVDLVTDPDALSIPPHITAGQVKGFALAAGKVMLDGGVGSMVERRSHRALAGCDRRWIGRERQLDRERRATAEFAVQGDPAAERLDSVPQPDEARAPGELGAATPSSWTRTRSTSSSASTSTSTVVASECLTTLVSASETT
jgi:hypothetical protein